MNKGLRVGLQLFLLIGASLIAYFGWKSVNEPVQFDKERDEKYIEVIHKMREIRDAQIAYRDYHNQYAPTWDDLISFIDTGKYVVLEKKDIKVMKTQRGLTYEGTETVIDTLDIVPLKDSLFKKYKNASKATINELRYIPGLQEKKEFEIESTLDEKYDSLNERNIRTIRFEVRAPKRDLLNALDDYDPFYIEREINAEKGIKDSILKVGSLYVNSTDGNWPKSYDLMVDDMYKKKK
ncbi:MAG: hypothetical protein ACK5MD_03505 [Flavobacteriales bacterium]